MSHGPTEHRHVLSSELLDRRDREAVLARLFDGRPPTTNFDVGAAVGRLSAAYLALFPAATLHAFEPHPESFAHLTQRLGADPRVRLENVAVADRTGTLAFQVNRLPYTSSLLARPSAARRYYPGRDGPQQRIDVPVVTLDDYCRRHGIPRIDIVKLDIQGGEMAALRGMEGLLRESRVDAIFTETFFVPHYEGAPLLHDLWAHLQARGYGLFTLFPTREGRNGQLRLGDAIFISAALREAVVDACPDEP